MYFGKPIIGLVGGIGSGKSTVAKLFGELGCMVVDSDAQVRDAYREPPVLETLRTWWGDQVLHPDGTVNRSFIAAKVFRPLGMTRTSMGLMGLPKSRTVPSQAAPAQTEAGKKSWPDWNWNSDYWRNLGAPWGGALGPAVDIGRFYEEFLLKRGTILKPETEALMIANQSPPGVKASGLLPLPA